MGLQTEGLCHAQPLNNGIFTAYEYSFETNFFLSRLCEIKLSMKDLKIGLNSVYRKFFIYVHKNLFAFQTLEVLEKLALIFLNNFHRDHILLKLIKISPKINVENIKNLKFSTYVFGT